VRQMRNISKRPGMSKRPGRPDPLEAAKTKERLVEAAIKEFAEYGLSGARVERIAERAEINKQAIYYYFKDKDALYSFALERCYELAHRNDDKLTFEGKSGYDAISALIELVFDDLNEMRDVIAIVSDENRNKGRHLPNPHIRTTNRPAIDAIAAVLERGTADGTLRSGIDAEHLWISILSLVMFYFTNAFTLSHLLNRDLLADGTVIERKEQIKELVLASLRPQFNCPG
jgi:AcrR family transcriptional regulator